MTNKNAERIKRIVRSTLTVLILLFLAVFCCFIPYRSLLPAYSFPARAEGELRVHVPAVGGDCTVVEFPGGNVLVVNAGDGSLESRNALIRYLKGIAPASVTFVAADSESVGGFSALFEEFPVEKAYLPAYGAETGKYRRFLEAAKEEGCPTERISRYTVLSDPSGAYAVCLSPYSEAAENSEADSSAVFWLSYEGVSFLLAGNTTAAREEKLVGEYKIDSGIFDAGAYKVSLDETDVLKVACHGADTASSAEFLSLIGAKTAIVSCGLNAKPSKNTVARLADAGAEVHRTDEAGSTVVSVKNGTYEVLRHFGAK